MRMAIDLKFDLHERRGWLVVIDRAGGESCARQRGQQQGGGADLYHRAAADLDFTGSIWLRIGFVLVHDLLQLAYGQMPSPQLGNIRLTTHRNDSWFEGLIFPLGGGKRGLGQNPRPLHARQFFSSPERISQLPERTYPVVSCSRMMNTHLVSRFHFKQPQLADTTPSTGAIAG